MPDKPINTSRDADAEDGRSVLDEIAAEEAGSLVADDSEREATPPPSSDFVEEPPQVAEAVAEQNPSDEKHYHTLQEQIEDAQIVLDDIPQDETIDETALGESLDEVVRLLDEPESGLGEIAQDQDVVAEEPTVDKTLADMSDEEIELATLMQEADALRDEVAASRLPQARDEVRDIPNVDASDTVESEQPADVEEQALPEQAQATDIAEEPEALETEEIPQEADELLGETVAEDVALEETAAGVVEEVVEDTPDLPEENIAEADETVTQDVASEENEAGEFDAVLGEFESEPLESGAEAPETADYDFVAQETPVEEVAADLADVDAAESQPEQDEEEGSLKGKLFDILDESETATEKSEENAKTNDSAEGSDESAETDASPSFVARIVEKISAWPFVQRAARVATPVIVPVRDFVRKVAGPAAVLANKISQPVVAQAERFENLLAENEDYKMYWLTFGFVSVGITMMVLVMWLLV